MKQMEQKQRDYFFDNFRLILMLTVVIAHFISPLSKVEAIKYIYRYIYIFHMPGMLFISGFFSKSSVKDGKLVKNKIFNYTLLYIVFQVLYTIINKGRFSIYQSQMGLWYIQVLIIYSAMLPILTRIKDKYVILSSMILGLLVGLDKSAGHVASLSRVLVFLPFFMMGYYVKREQLEKLFKKRYLIISVLILVIIGVGLYGYMDKIKWLLNMVSGKSSYAAMKLSNIKGIIYRLGWYVLSSVLCLAIMILTPKKKKVFSKFGERTLQIFCLHIIVCILLRKTNLYVYLSQYGGFGATTISLLLGTVITFLLGLKIFSYPFNWIMNCKFRMLLK